MDIKANLEQVKKSFQNPNCQLIAVSKTKPLADLQAAYAAGIRDFGKIRFRKFRPSNLKCLRIPVGT